MEYAKIWQKVLNPGEEIRYEFSLGDRYINLMLVPWGIFGLLFVSVWGAGVVIIAGALFYYGFYLRRANSYAFTSQRVLIHRGWLSTRTVSINHDKITDVSVEEPFLERILAGTGHLTIRTAGTGFNEITLRHIAKPYEAKKKLVSLENGRDMVE